VQHALPLVTGDARQGRPRRLGEVVDLLGLRALADQLVPDTAADLYNQADEAIWEIGHSMPIIQQPLISAQSPKLANYGARAGATDLDWTIVGFTK
jgi:hypothetical protein